MDHVARSGLTLGADHGSAFGNAPQGFTQVARAADKRCLEGVLVHVVRFVGRGKNFRFVNVIHAQRLEYLRLGKVADPALGHHGNGDRFHDLANLLGRCHACNAALRANLCRTRSNAITAVAPAFSAISACERRSHP